TVEQQTGRSLAEWVDYIGAMHPQNIALGLDRIGVVKERLAIHFSCPVVIVGGTNGKGSTCMMLETIWRMAGYRVGQYTSPHIHRFNERIRIDGQMVDDEVLICAFEAVEAVRGDVPLTFFEFTTLVAMKLFADAGLNVAVFEVGLGGRFDAVNLLDADVAIVTNVAIDHQAFLGDTREKIGFEKAGIYRQGRIALYGELEPPQSLLDHVAIIGADLKLYGRDYIGEADGNTWHYQGPSGSTLWELPRPSLYGDCQIANAATVLTVVHELQDRLPVYVEAVFEALPQVRLPGRFDIIQHDPLVIVDVAHNPHAARTLADNLRALPCEGRTLAVYGAMADKDIKGVVCALKDQIDVWYITNLPLPRAATVDVLLAELLAVGVPREQIVICEEVEKALDSARKNASNNDRIAAFGSFWVVTGVTAA
ncbi:MAG: bifunctional tetrahydrofolate synthase/dihydrofolate synthase, partial [Oxalobacter sp.]